MKNDLTGKDLEWIGKAATTGDGLILVHIHDDFAIGLDGYRSHVINPENLPDKLNNLDVKRSFNKLEKFTTIENVLVSVDYLVDALSGMHDVVSLSIMIQDNDHIAIKIGEGNKQAIIMCMRAIEEEDDKDEW